MMAFYTVYREDGAKQYRPTPDLEKMLGQDQVTQEELSQFRSSNKVEALLGNVLKNRGFKKDWENKRWVRGPSVHGDDVGHDQYQLKAIEKLIAERQGPIGELFVKQIEDSSAVSYLLQRLNKEGWQYRGDIRAYWPPPKKPSVDERVQQAMHTYMLQFGQPPNKLWISNKDWYELTYKLTYKENPFSGGAASGGLRLYQGMKVELMAPGAELFVGTAADTNQSNPSKLEGVHHGSIISDDKSVPVGIALGTSALDGTVPIQLLSPIKFLHVDEPEPPKPRHGEQAARKRITPPSQLKRKLAL